MTFKIFSLKLFVCVCVLLAFVNDFLLVLVYLLIHSFLFCICTYSKSITIINPINWFLSYLICNTRRLNIFLHQPYFITLYYKCFNHNANNPVLLIFQLCLFSVLFSLIIRFTLVFINHVVRILSLLFCCCCFDHCVLFNI